MSKKLESQANLQKNLISHGSSQNSEENIYLNKTLSPEEKNALKEEIVKCLYKVSTLSKELSSSKISALASILVNEYSFTLEHIKNCCKLFVESESARYREIQLCDFTNPSLLYSEISLKEKAKQLNAEWEKLKEAQKNFHLTVQREVERRLDETHIELKKISSKFEHVKVPASQALYVATKLLEEKKLDELERLKCEMKKRLEEAYKAVLAQI